MVLVAGVLLLGMWGNLARGLDQTHVHVVCPEHGELIEQVHNSGPRRAEFGVDPALVHDEGCALAAWSLLATVGLLPPAPAEIPDRVATRTPLGTVRWAAGVAVAPLRNAPKTSPPGA